MQRLAAAVLEHHVAGGRHFDWLLEDPRTLGQPDARLWTARCTVPPRHWTVVRTWLVTVIAPHRRAYLRYQGPIREHRGRVRRVDQGSAICHLWTDHRIDLDLRMAGFVGRVNLTRLDRDVWRARTPGSAPAPGSAFAPGSALSEQGLPGPFRADILSNTDAGVA